MRFGVCIGVPAGEAGFYTIGRLAEIGYDYVELPLSRVMELPEAEFQALVEGFKTVKIGCEAMNIFFPPRIRLTGEDASLAAVDAYVRDAVSRASRLMTEVLVMGSAGSRNVPDGFPRERAWEQLVEALQLIDPLAAEAGVAIAVEPLNRGESNILNALDETLTLVHQVNRPNIQALVDYYHLALEKEPMEHIVEAGVFLRHVHFSQVEGRVFPTHLEDGYEQFFDSLKAAGYKRRVSIEAGTADLLSDAELALGVLRQAAG